MPSVWIRTFGCQMNVYDTGKIYALLAKDGFVVADGPEEADLVLLNTCSIRYKAQHKLHSALGELRALGRRRARPLHLGVAGCVAQQEGQALLDRYPDLGLVMGPDGVPHVRALVARVLAGERTLDATHLPLVDYPFVPDVDPSARERVTGLVTIQKGCDNHCTYCIVPSVRGREVSRPSADILDEVRALVDQGVPDITLIGQNVNGWGKSLPERPRFAALLRRVAATPGLQRLHYTTSHPKDMDDDLIAAHGDLEVLVPHLHLPVRSGSDRILKRMGRKYTREHYLDVARRLREARPGLTLTSDFIVGFPGETDADFAETRSLMDAADIVMSFSFMYSPRPGTAAPRLPDPVPHAVSGARLMELQDHQRARSLAWHASLVGRTFPVLVEGPSRHDEGVVAGRTPHGAMVNFPGSIDRVGQTADVRVTRGFTHSCRGELV